MSLYGYTKQSPISKLDSFGLAGCRVCSTIEAVEEVKDESGVVVACALRYKSQKATSYNSSVECHSNCDPISGCEDLFGPNNRRPRSYIHYKAPSKKGWYGIRTTYCPDKSSFPQEECFGVIGWKCKQGAEKAFQDCEELCKLADYATVICSRLPEPARTYCKITLSQTPALCRDMCEATTLKRVPDPRIK